jgi:hypothetical protein
MERPSGSPVPRCLEAGEGVVREERRAGRGPRALRGIALEAAKRALPLLEERAHVSYTTSIWLRPEDFDPGAPVIERGLEAVASGRLAAYSIHNRVVVRGIALPFVLTLALGEDGSLAAAGFTRQDFFEAGTGGAGAVRGGGRACAGARGCSGSGAGAGKVANREMTPGGSGRHGEEESSGFIGWPHFVGVGQPDTRIGREFSIFWSRRGWCGLDSAKGQTLAGL